MTKWQYVRLVLFSLLGIWIIVLSNEMKNNVAYLVGGIMLIFGLENIIPFLVNIKKEDKKVQPFLNGILELTLGLVLIIMLRHTNSIATVCIVWAVWSIINQGTTVANRLGKIKNKILLVVSVIESLTIITLSIIMLSNPLEHIFTHIILLGIELILFVWVDFIDYEYLKHIKSQTKNA